MPEFLYETHAHTEEASKCSSISARKLVGFYRDRGVKGICITDHFFNGNSAVPTNLSWAQRVDWLCMGYEHAAEEGARIGVDVFFGWEYSLFGTDFLTYGLDKAWLLRHPEVMELSVNDYCALVRSEGGFIIHAHPYREAWYIDMIRLLPRSVDGVEVVNASRTDFENARAEEYAANYGLLRIGGSDNHIGAQPHLAGIGLDRPLADIQDMIAAIRSGEAKVVSL